MDVEETTFTETRAENKEDVISVDPINTDRPVAIRAQKLQLYVGQPPKTTHVLKDFKITVPTGVIYGILGPSGCGKTSFLKCVVGIKKPTSGDITVFGYKPGTIESGVPGAGVGYMPQDIALQHNLNIQEILHYFGQLYFIDAEFIAKQTDYLVKSLALPEKTQLIGNLSEGQKRRVSYACALVHNPRLVILDEPTVGVDPILRERIWKHLTDLTKNNVTIIVTTHYIEETRRADTVGFMENGQLSIAASPQKLMDKLNVKTLEEVFYRISNEEKQKLKEARERDERESIKYHNMGKQPYYAKKLPLTYFILAWISNLFTITDKLMIQIKRTPEQIIALFVLPTVVIMVFCVCVGESPHDIYVAVVNEENPHNYSKLFIDSLPSYVIKSSYYDNFDEAIQTVKERKNFAVIQIRANFTRAITDRVEIYRKIANLREFQKYDINFTVEQSTITIHGDASHKPLFVTMERVFEQSLLKFIHEIAKIVGVNPQITGLLIKEGEIMYGQHIEGDYAGWRDFETSGILILLVYTFACGVQILAILSEKNDKIYDRVYVAGVKPSQIMFAHLIARFTSLILTVVVMFVVAVYIFSLPAMGSVFWAMVLLMLQVVTGLGNGLFLSAICTSAVTCSFIANGLLMTWFIVSGTLWPFEGLPYWIRWIASFSPITAPTESLRSILLRGWSIGHPTVYWGFLMSFGWSFVFIFLSIVAFNLTK